MMEKKVRNCLTIFGLILPKPVKELIIELGVEIDRLRADLEKLRSKT